MSLRASSLFPFSWQWCVGRWSEVDVTGSPCCLRARNKEYWSPALQKHMGPLGLQVRLGRLRAPLGAGGCLGLAGTPGEKLLGDAHWLSGPQMIFVGHISHIKKTQPYPAHLPLTLEAAGSWWAHLESPGSQIPAGRTPYCPPPVSRPASSASLPSLRSASQTDLLSAHLSLLTWMFQRPSVPGINHPTGVVHPLPPQTPITSYQPI